MTSILVLLPQARTFWSCTLHRLVVIGTIMRPCGRAFGLVGCHSWLTLVRNRSHRYRSSIIFHTAILLRLASSLLLQGVTLANDQWAVRTTPLAPSGTAQTKEIFWRAFTWKRKLWGDILSVTYGQQLTTVAQVCSVQSCPQWRLPKSEKLLWQEARSWDKAMEMPNTPRLATTI